MIKLTIPSIDENDLQAVRDVLSSGYLVQGEQVKSFENAITNYVGSKYAIAVANCTAALHISLMALGVRPGDLVVVTAYSWLSTANVVELCGAQPVFVDICTDTFNMDPDCLERVLTELMSKTDTNKRVKAILPVHTFGQIADMPKILEQAERYNLPVIEDAACALGATLHGRQAGTWGQIGCFSFHPRKAITTGEGGIIVTNDIGLAKHLKALRNHGQDPDANSPQFIMPGFNYRMTEFQAALGFCQMTKLDRIIEIRRHLATSYNKFFEGTLIQPPLVSKGVKHVYQSYIVLLPKHLASKRQTIIEHLKKVGIETTIGTYHMPMTTYFRSRYNYRMGDFPIAEQVFACSLSLPLYEGLSFHAQQYIEETLIKHCNGNF
jgi:dTDP-4-amino-4,6-dideoxygalactose transaminase